MDVIRTVLTEEDVVALGSEYMTSLADCSTATVMTEVRRYVRSSGQNPKALELVQQAFAGELLYDSAINDEVLMSSVHIVTGLRYSHINNMADTGELESWDKAIKLLASRGVMRPYKAPVKSYAINELIDTLKQIPEKKQLAKKLYMHRGTFSELHTSRAVGTPFKRIFFASDEIKIMQQGLEFLLRMRRSNIPPVKWRFL